MKDFISQVGKCFSQNKVLTKTISFFLCLVLVFLIIPTVVYVEAIDSITNANNSSDIDEENHQDFSYKSANYEITELREESVKHFRTSDGKYVAAQYNYPVHYLDEDGSWQDIDNVLYASGSEYMTSDARIKFAKKITGNENLFTLHNGNKKITFSLNNATKGTVGNVVNGKDAKTDTELQKMMNLEKLSASIIYENILDGVDLEYIASSNNIKENIIVKEKKDSYSYAFTLKLNNLSAKLDASGNVQILDNTDSAIYTIPAPVVWDSAYSYAPTGIAAYTLTDNGSGKYSLTINVDSSWVNDEERVFPVTVDPAVKLNPSSVTDTYVDFNNPTSSYSSEIYFSVSNTTRAYWKMGSTPSIPKNSYISKAYLSLHWINGNAPVYAHQVTSSWGSDLTYNQALGSAGNYNPAPMDYQEFSSEGRYSWDITSAVRDWYSSSSLNHGIALLGGSSVASLFYSNDDSYDKPAIVIEYIDTKGIEDYQSYSSHSIGAAGSGSINLATGQLSLIIPTLTTTDGLFGFTPSLVRNSEMTGRYYGYSYSQTPYISYMPIGYKWNFTETVVTKTFTDANGESFTVYVLSDSDGTEHVFTESTNYTGVYYDEDGLLLTLIPDNSGLSVTITDINNTVKTYTSSSANLGYWYLQSVKDKNGNQLHFTLDSKYRVTDVGIIPVGNPRIQILKIGYGSSTGDPPRYIYNVSSKEAVVFKYSSLYNGTIAPSGSVYLRQAIFLHGSSGMSETNLLDFYSNSSNTANITVDATMSYEYDSAGKIISVTDNLSQYSVSYAYSTNGKVTAVTEKAGSTTGQTVKFDYYNGYTESISSGNDEAIDTADDIYTRYIFDERGRVVSSYSTDRNKTVIYGATNGIYETQENAKNNIKNSATVSGSSSNYIINGDFEIYSGNLPQYWSFTNASITNQIDGIGEKRAVLNVNPGVTSQISQKVFLPFGTYTLSADIYTYCCQGISISLLADGNSDYTKEVPVVEYENSNTARISLTFTASSIINGGEYINVSIKAIGSSSVTSNAYVTVDNVMLEEGIGSTGYELVNIGNFENNVVNSSNTSIADIGSFWTRHSSGNVDYVTSDSLFAKSARLTPNTEIKQRIYTAPNTQTILNCNFIISSFGKSAEAMINDKSRFGIRIDVVYYDNSGNNFTVPYYFSFTAGCRDWQFISGSFSVQNDKYLNYIDVVCEYYNQSFGYGYFDNISVKLDTDGNVQSYTYYENGMTKSSENVLFKEYYEYDSLLKLTRVANNCGKLTDYYYDAIGNVTREVSSEFTWNNTKDYPINLTQAEKNAQISKSPKTQTTYGYNGYGNNLYSLTIETDVLSSGDIIQKAGTQPIRTERTYVTTSGSKIFGVMTGETDQLRVTTYKYYDDKNGRLLAEVNSSTGNGICYMYDAIGNLIKVRPATYTSSSQYSAITNAESVTYTYNAKNHLATIITEGTHYTLTSDPFGNISSIKAGDNVIASYTYYQNNGKLKKVSYSNGFSEEYVYDTLENLSEIWYNYSDGSRTKAYTYLYNSDGQLYRYDDLLRQKSTVYDYTLGGNITSAIEYSLSDGYTDFEETFDYDNNGRLGLHYYKLTTGTEAVNKSLQHTYQYNSDGSLAKATLYTELTRGSESFTYDNFGRATKYVNYHYLASNTATEFKNTVEYVYYINSAQNTTALVYQYKTTVNSTTTTYTYTYDGSGNIVSIYNSATNQCIYYKYDDLGQLIREDNQPWGYTYVYEYDNAGNRTKKTSYAYTTADTITSSPRSTTNMSYSASAWGDMLTAYGNNAITYDAIGNPLVYKAGANFTFTWEGRRLASATKALGTITFTYNDEGIRTSKTNTSGVTTYYTLSGNRILSESRGNEVFVYIYDSNGAPMGMQYRKSSYADGVYDIFWFEKNLQGDIIAVYNEAGTLLMSYNYDAWGSCAYTSHNGGSSTAAYYNPFRYRGYYYDSDLTMYYLNSRYYDQVTGRFISPDTPEVTTVTPMSLTDKNLYAYCDNNPVMRRDDGGEFWNVISGAVIGATINVVASATVSWLNGEKYTWKNALVDGVAGAASGALAATGFGLVTQTLANGLISGASSVAADGINGDEIDITRAINATALGLATGFLGGAGLRTDAAVKKADKTCLKVLNKATSGGYATIRGAKSAMTQAVNGLHNALRPAVKKTSKLFLRSSFLGATGMYAYDYVNR